MTLTQRLAVSALAPCPICGGDGVLPVLDVNMLHHRDVRCDECDGFGTTEQELDHALDAVREAVKEGDRG